MAAYHGARTCQSPILPSDRIRAAGPTDTSAPLPVPNGGPFSVPLPSRRPFIARPGEAQLLPCGATAKTLPVGCSNTLPVGCSNTKSDIAWQLEATPIVRSDFGTLRAERVMSNARRGASAHRRFIETQGPSNHAHPCPPHWRQASVRASPATSSVAACRGELLAPNRISGQDRPNGRLRDHDQRPDRREVGKLC
jgi:hypothetical protein